MVSHVVGTRPFGIRAYLTFVAGAALVPLAVALGLQIAERFQRRSELALESMQQISASLAGALAEVLDNNRELLGSLAQRPGMQLEIPPRCDPLLEELARLNRRFANATITSRSGDVVCSGVPMRSGQTVNVGEAAFFRAMLASRRFTVSEPFLGPITGQWVVAQIHPRFDRDGRVVGGVGIPLDLEALQSLLERGAGVASLGARVVSASGRIVASSRLPEEPLGRDISNEPLGRALRGSPPPKFSAVGLNGAEQLFGATPVPGTSWVMVVSEDRHYALGPAYEGLRNGALALIVALALAALATAALARRIAEPVRNLAQVAARIAAGEHGARAPASGPGEIAHVAREFNRMLERREAIETERSSLLERISDGFVGLDRDWKYVYINRKGAELLGRTPEQLIGKHIWTEFPDGVGRPFHLAYERAMREQTPIRIEEYYPPFGRWFENRIYPSQEGISIFYSDITELKIAESALRENARRLRLAIEAADLYYWEWDIQADRLIWGRDPAGLLGAPPPGGEGYPDFRRLVHADDLERFLAAGRATRDSGAPYAHEFRIVTANGEVRWVSATAALLRDSAGAPQRLLGVSRDVSAPKRAERALREARDRLQALSRKVLAAQEEERARIARELHDEVGQALTAVKLNLQGLRRGGRSEARGEALADSLAVIDRTIHDVRALSLDLRPQILDDLGLLPTLKWYCERQSTRAGVPISLEVEALGRDEVPEFATACYRIVQEAVTNALRHAEAKHISVALKREGERIGLSIRDDGRGFDVETARAAALGGRSSGLTGIFERAELAGGSAVVESAAGQGTRVRIEFPAQA